MTDSTTEITRLVERWSNGDEAALDPLVSLAYDDLRQIARRHLRSSPPDQTISTTALVNELYLRLADITEGSWGGRAQFFAFCSRAMRRILIDYARRRKARKRGGDLNWVPLSEDPPGLEVAIDDILAVEAALTQLELRDPRMARIAEYRYFGGLSVPETAEALEISIRTVEREWARAKAYLRQALT